MCQPVKMIYKTDSSGKNVNIRTESLEYEINRSDICFKKETSVNPGKESRRVRSRKGMKASVENP